MALGGGEILVILLVALIVFGPQRLPEIARQIGKAMSEVRKMQDSVKRELHGALGTDEDHSQMPPGVTQGAPSYDEHQVPPESHNGEHPSPPHSDPHGDMPSAGSFS
jgi:Tat protein translocase TatB subunit